MSHSLQQRRLRKVEASVGDAVHKVQGHPDEALTVEQDKVVLEDQQRAVGDQDKALEVVVPVVNPEQQDKSRLRQVVDWFEDTEGVNVECTPILNYFTYACSVQALL